MEQLIIATVSPPFRNDVATDLQRASWKFDGERDGLVAPRPGSACAIRRNRTRSSLAAYQVGFSSTRRMVPTSREVTIPADCSASTAR